MTLVVTHTKVSGKPAGTDPDRVYGTHWDANHTLTGTVSNAQLDDMGDSTVKGRAAGAGTGDAQDLTGAQVKAIIGGATSSTDNAVVRFDGTSGGTQNSGVTIDDSNNVDGVASVALDNAGWVKGRNAANSADLNMLRVNSSNFTEWSNPLYYDNLSAFIDRGSVLAVQRDLGSTAPSTVQPNITSVAVTKGTNTTFVGASAAYLQARDRTDVVDATKGVLYACATSIVPLVQRDPADAPYDDTANFVAQNDGNYTGRAAFYSGRNGAITNTYDYEDVIQIDSWGSATLFRATGTYPVGIELADPNALATFSTAAIRIPNNSEFLARNAANSGNISIAKVDTSNQVLLRSGVIAIGASGFTVTPGNINLVGSSSGTITLQPQAAAGTYNWNWPTTAGTSGYVLTSGGGGSTAMTWTQLATVATSASAADLSTGILPDARMPNLTGDVTTSEGAVATTIATNAVSNAKFRQSAALSVVGRSANSTGDVADIAAGSDYQVLRRSGTAVGFGAVDLTQSNAVTGLLPTGNGGMATWQNWTPTLGSVSGTITTKSTISARYTTANKTTIFAATFLVTTNGTGDYLTFTLPTTPNASGGIAGWDAVAGVVYLAKLQGANTTATLVKYDGTWPRTDGNYYQVSGSYEHT